VISKSVITHPVGNPLTYPGIALCAYIVGGGNGDTFGGFLLFMYLVDGLPDAGLRVFPAPSGCLRNASFKRMDLAAAAAGMFPCHHFADGKRPFTSCGSSSPTLVSSQ